MNSRERLLASQDSRYRDFQAKLCPTVDPEKIIGVRTPALRALAREMLREGTAEPFLNQLPHEWFEENQLHIFILSEWKDYDILMEKLELFLPYIDNWATCDQLSPKVFRKNRDKLLPQICHWLTAAHPYTVRFGIGMLMQHYLDEDFAPEYLEWVCNVKSEEYYVNMMIAWYFATALAKQYDAALPYLQQHRLPTWVHRKTIQKARESYRITPEQKEALKTLK